MYCDQCGELVQLSGTFCTKCGCKIQNIKEGNNTEKSGKTIPHAQTLVRKYKWAFVVFLIAVVSGSYWYASRPELERGTNAYKNHDYETAFKNFRPLAEQGNPKAQFLLAGLYVGGQGVNRDEKQAFNWATKSATQGYLDAQYLLSLMYVNGLGVSTDGYKSAYWLTKAAGNRQEEALIRVNQNPMFLLNIGVLAAQNGDYESAFQVIKYFAEKGDAQAQYYLGGLYLEGKGTSIDISQAMAWYTKSSDQGNIDARVALYKLNANDHGLVQENVPEPSIPVNSKLTESGLTYFLLKGNMNCNFIETDTQCQQFVKDLLPNGGWKCDTSMVSGGAIIWGRKYQTASGESESLILRSGRGWLLSFIPSTSVGCSSVGNDLSIGTYGAGETVEDGHKGEGATIALMVKGNTLYYVFLNSISWNNKSKQYEYGRTVYKVSTNGLNEFYRQNFTNKALIKFDEALPLKNDLVPY